MDQYIHRIVVEEDALSKDDVGYALYAASSEAGEKLYKRGDFAESRTPNLDIYLLKSVKKQFETYFTAVTAWTYWMALFFA